MRAEKEKSLLQYTLSVYCKKFISMCGGWNKVTKKVLKKSIKKVQRGNEKVWSCVGDRNKGTYGELLSVTCIGGGQQLKKKRREYRTNCWNNGRGSLD